MATLTEKQKIALQAVSDGSPIGMRNAGALKSLGLIVTKGAAGPGYVSATITPAGIDALA